MQTGRKILALFISIAVLELAIVPAVPSTLDDLAQMGEDAMKAGNYTEAIRHYKRITEIGQTYVSLLAVMFDLGWCYYLTGQAEEAIPLFEHLSSKRSPSEAVKQQSLFLLAECHARVAAGKPEDSPERKKAAQAAIDLHTKFQSEYAQNPNIAQSLYGRAYAYFLIKEMDKAEVDLKTVITRQPRTTTARDATFLLASVYSSQGLIKLKTGDKASSQEYTEKARQLFSELAQGEGVNLGSANDSVFSLGETWFAAGEHMQAIRYYQQLRSKEEVAHNVQKLEALVQQRLMDEIRRDQNTTATKAEGDKLRAQIRDILKAPDMMISGYFRIADAFYQIERLDEMRAVCRHLISMESIESNSKMQAAYMIINSYLKEGMADEAAEEFELFQQTFGYDVQIVDTVGMSIGQLYLAAGETEKAAQFFQKNIQEHPEGRAVEDALYLKFAAQYMDKKYDETIAGTSEYIEKFPTGKYIPNAMYYKAMSLASQLKWDESFALINAVIEKYPKGTEEFNQIDEAFYQKGWMLNEMKKAPEAVAQLEEFLKKFEKSPLRPEAMYQLGVALNDAGRIESAKHTLKEIHKEYPDHYIAPLALYQVFVMYFHKQNHKAMEEALKDVVKFYPEHSIAVDSYYWLGWIARADDRYDDAVEMLTESLNRDPAHHLAPQSQNLIAQALQTKAQKMGRPTVLTEELRAVYKATVIKTVEEFENLIAKYRQSPLTLDAVPAIADNILDLLRYRQMDQQEALDYFKTAIGRHENDSNTRALLSYSMGVFLMKTGEKETALDAFNEAFSINPDIWLSSTMLAQYAAALKEAGELAKSETIYRKIIADYPDDPHALAPAWFGLADIKYRENEFDEAETLFKKVLAEFDWYQEGRQGRVMLARILEEKKQYAEAEKQFQEVWRQETGITRLGAMLGVARCQIAQAEAGRKSGGQAWKELVIDADKTLTRIIVMFEAYPDSVAEALWLKGNAYELIGEQTRARETYSRLVLDEEYKNIEWTGRARERLNRIGGILAPGS